MLQSKSETRTALRGPGTTGGPDVSINFATRVGHIAFRLLIQGMLAWMLLPEGRGSYAVCVVFGTVLGLISTPGAQQGAQYFVAARQTSVSQGVSSAVAISLTGGGLAIALALPLIHSDIAFFDKASMSSFHWALVLVPLTALSIAVECQLIALRRFRGIAVILLLQMLVNVLAILFLVWDRGLGVDGAIVAFAAGHLAKIALCLLDLRRYCGLVPEAPSRSSLARILRYGLKYHAARVGDGIGSHAGVLVLGLIASPSDVGLFAAASTLMLGFFVVSNAVGNALFPRIAGRENFELVALSFRLVCCATAVGLAATLVMATPLVRLLLSEAFLPTIPLLWITAPGVLAGAGAAILKTHFKSIDRPDTCSWIVCLGSCVNLAVLPFLYPTLGIEAAAWALTAGMLCQCVLSVIVFKNMTRMAWFQIWLPRRSDAHFLWAAGRSVLSQATEKRSIT